MSTINYLELILKEIAKEKEIIWINPDKTTFREGIKNSELTMEDVEDAEARLTRFAPFIMKCFPETSKQGGIIESELVPVPHMQKLINEKYKSNLKGRLLLKKDSSGYCRISQSPQRYLRGLKAYRGACPGTWNPSQR